MLELRQPNMLLVGKRMLELQGEIPKPPMVWLESKGREEPNESDPAYVAEVSLWAAKIKETSFEIYVLTGTRIHNVPEDMMTSESDDFADYLDAMGVKPSKNRHERYIQWCKYYATSPVDWQNIITSLQRMCGVSEEEVAAMQQLFPDDEERETPQRMAPEGSGQDGYSASPDDARSGLSVRADGRGDGLRDDTGPMVPDGAVGTGHAAGVRQDP